VAFRNEKEFEKEKKGEDLYGGGGSFWQID
jgi:hypothetical protein